MTIKTNKELLSAIEQCRDSRHIKDDNKQKVFDEQTKAIKDVLAGLEETTELPAYNSLKFEGKFGDFVINATDEELKKRLELIYHDLFEWRDVGYKVKAVGHMRKGKMKLIIAVLGLLAVATLVFGILSAFEKMPPEVGGIIGALDCTLGLLFFAWELYDDKIKESEIFAGDERLLEKHLSDEDWQRYNNIIASGENPQAAGGDIHNINNVRGNNFIIAPGDNNQINS